MPWLKKAEPKCNILSVRLSDKELELAIKKAGGRDRIGQYIRAQLFTNTIEENA